MNWEALYPYTADLMALDFCRPSKSVSCRALSGVHTPLIVEAWEAALQAHPDKAFSNYIINGTTNGFRIGFQREAPLRQAQINMGSALLHPEVVTAYLGKELALGRMLGPFSPGDPLPPLQVNRFGVIPKGQNTGKWRLITDLSYPPEQSVNDGIDPELCSLVYTTVDKIARRISDIGPGALMAKIDIESAYRLIPVHPDDRPLQAMSWNGQIFIDPMLPFGLRSAPKIFNAVADALNWHLQQKGIQDIDHYLDDFIIIAPAASTLCQEYLSILDRECEALGIPLAAHKRAGPTTTITFLGIEIDTIAGQLRLPTEKLTRLTAVISQWRDRRFCPKNHLQSLVGLLNHACKVVRPGRSFLRRMIDLLTTIRPSAPKTALIRLNEAFRADLAWWAEFLPQWNGISCFPQPPHRNYLTMTSDASGTWGCGAWHNTSWFQIQWDATAYPLTIAEKELIPIIIGCVVWGKTWENHGVTCFCDNQVVVASLSSKTSKHPGLMHLIRCLAFAEAKLNFTLHPRYINTRANFLADDLSRDNLVSFSQKAPHMDKYSTPTSTPLLQLLLERKADWTSPYWRPRFNAIFRQA